MIKKFISGLPVVVLLSFLSISTYGQYYQHNTLEVPATIFNMPYLTGGIMNTTLGGGYNFNLIVCGNMTVSTGETEGRLLVGGDFTSGTTLCDATNPYFNYATGFNTSGLGLPVIDSDTAHNIIAGGNFTLETGAVQANWNMLGAALYGGAITASPFVSQNTTYHVSGLVNALALKNHYQSLAATIGGLTTTGTVTYQPFSYTIMNGVNANAGFYVFNLDYAQMDIYAGIAFQNVNPGAQIFINLTGTPALILGSSGGKSLTINEAASSITIDDSRKYVLLNLPNATSVTCNSMQLDCSLLAAQADAIFNGGEVNGEVVIGGNMNGCNGAGFHNFPVLLSENNTPLPTNNLVFKAYWNKDNAILNWNVRDQRMIDYFEAEYSDNGADFVTLGKILPVKSSIPTPDYHYSFIHTPKSNRSFYRLKTKNRDGNSVYSNVMVLNKTDVLNTTFSLYPNPVKDKLMLDIQGAVGHQIFVLNQMGVTLYQNTLKDKNNSIDFSGFPSGVYIIRYVGSQGIITKKVLKF